MSKAAPSSIPNADFKTIEKQMLFTANPISKKQIQKNENGIDVVLIEGYASTADEDRHGDIILLSAWNAEVIAMYMENPVLLFNHDYRRPEGRVTEMAVDDRGLYVKAEVIANSEVGQRIAAGVIKTFSVGFRLKDYFFDEALDVFKITALELYEISVVSIPANRSAQFNLAKSFEGALGDNARSTLIQNHLNHQENMNTKENNVPEAADKALAPNRQEEDQLGGITKLFKSFREEIKSLLKGNAGSAEEAAEEAAPATKSAEEVIAELKAEAADLKDQLKAAKDEIKGLADIEAKAEEMINAKIKEFEATTGQELQAAKSDLATKSQELEDLKVKYDKLRAGKTTPEGGSDPVVTPLQKTGNMKAYESNVSFFI